MNNKICTALLLIFIGIGLIGCGNTNSYSDKEYVMATTESKLQRTQIDLDSYRIHDGAMISLSDLINVKNMSLEMASFYDEDNLLLLYVDKDYTKLDAYLFSLIYGELQWQGRIENISGMDAASANYCPVSMQPLVIMEKSTRKVWLIEDKVVQMEMVLGDCALGTTVGTEEGMYYINEAESSIQKMLYATGTATTVFSDSHTYNYEIRNLDYISSDGKYLYATGVNKLKLSDTTFVIDIRSGEMVANIDKGYSSWEGESSVYSLYQDNSQWHVLKRQNNNYETVKEFIILPQVHFDYFVYNEDIIITEENDGAVYNFSLYDLTSGQKNRNTQIDFGAYFRDTFAEEGGYSSCIIDADYAYNSWRNMFVFEIISENNNRKVFLWDINSANEEAKEIDSDEYIEQINMNSISETAYEGLSNVLHSIYEQYGVSVYIGDNIPSRFTDYCAGTNESRYYMETAVETVLEVLKYYPEDFFDMFTTNNYSSGINIYFVGDMTPVSEEYISNPSGFATSMQEFEVMAININYTDAIEQNLCHEISHAIYNRIDYEEIYSGNTYFDETKWAELNPNGFEYYGGYRDSTGADYEESDDVKYTKDAMNEDSDIDKVYFVDSYSKTFLTEDLARLMEYNMVFSDSKFLESPHLKAKMAFYSDAIRSVWDSKKWPETTRWEVNNE